MPSFVYDEPEREYFQKIFQASSALQLDSHFVYKEGTHGSQYVDKDDLLSDPKILDQALKLLCRSVVGSLIKFDVICGIATGATALAAALARDLKSNHFGYDDLRSIYVVDDPADPKNKKLIKGSLAKYIKGGKRVLIVEDVVNNGNSLLGAINAIRENGGEVAAAICVVNRNADKITPAHFGLDEHTFLQMLTFQMDNYPESECPMCQKEGPGTVRTDLGKGKDFLRKLREQGAIA